MGRVCYFGGVFFMGILNAEMVGEFFYRKGHQGFAMGREGFAA
jgi:hypothetical protein